MSAHAENPGFVDLLTARARTARSRQAYLHTDEHGSPDEAAESRWVAAESDVPLVARLCHQVQSHLPWIAAGDGLPIEMRVMHGGYLEWDHPLHPAGTPYVAVGVDSWDAAEAVREALEPIARLDEAAWDLDWERAPQTFRLIRVFPRARPA